MEEIGASARGARERPGGGRAKAEYPHPHGRRHRPVQDLTALGATVIDLTDVKADDPTNHDKFAQLAEVAPELRDVLEHGVGARSAVTRQETAGNALGSIVSLPVTFLGAPVRIIAGQ